MNRNRPWRHLIASMASAFAALMILLASPANANVSNGWNAGQRGLRTISVPPSTRTTTPKPAHQHDRTAASAGQIQIMGLPKTPNAQNGGVLGRPGLLGGLAAGFFGAGLFGLVSGNGVFSSIDGMVSAIGLCLQFALVILIARFLWLWAHRRPAPALASLSPRELADVYGRPRADSYARFTDTASPASAGGIGPAKPGLRHG